MPYFLNLQAVQSLPYKCYKHQTITRHALPADPSVSGPLLFHCIDLMTSCCRHSFQEGTLWLWLCVLLLISRVSDACTAVERIALLEIRVSLLGSTAGFTNMPQSWQQSDDCCSWDGVACNNVTRHVSHLQLSFLDGVSPKNGASIMHWLK